MHPPLEVVPVEIVIRIFCSLCSLHDAQALAATSHRLQAIWTADFTSIYAKLGPRAIPCEKHARRLLIEQNRLPDEFEKPTVSVSDIAKLLRNKEIVEVGLLEFEQQYVRKLKWPGFSPYPKHYFSAGRAHLHPFDPRTKCLPKRLTPPERLRLTKLFYQHWIMMTISSASWASQLQQMTLKDMYLLFEMSHIAGSKDSKQNSILPSSDPVLDLYSMGGLGWNIHQKRLSLRQQIWPYIQSVYQGHHNIRPEPIIGYASEEGIPPFVGIWDHWQVNLKDWVCGPRCTTWKEELWEHGSDDDDIF